MKYTGIPRNTIYLGKKKEWEGQIPEKQQKLKILNSVIHYLEMRAHA